MTKKILRIMSSPRSEASVSRKLGSAIVEKIRLKYPDSEVRELDLVKTSLPHLQEEQINLFFTPVQQLTSVQADLLKSSTESIAALQAADIIVIEAPMYNYTITSPLKAFIDHIVRFGVTFARTEKGIEGLIKNKKVYVAIASGFVYSTGPFKDFDFITPYLTKMLGWIGMNDITFYRAEGGNVPEVKEGFLERAIGEVVIN